MKTTKVQTKNVKLVGGVMGGRMVAIPRSAETLRIGGFWTYEYAGREGRQELFAMRPMSRVARRLIYWFIGKHGKDPRVEAAASKRTPVTNTGRVAHGRGAAKRRARVQPTPA
jgi:hypothetical protein